MTYNAESIQQLSFREGVQKRVGIYLGSADHTGVLAGLLELVNNATDEALVCPTAKTIEVTVGKDWASCRDYGRGMPHGANSFSKEVMINLLTENHSGAKFDANAYGGKSRGLNGTGSAATCCSSDWFEISSYRDGAEWFMRFDKGIPEWDECQKKPLGNNKQGTYIKYKPSQEVFKSEPVYFDYHEVCDVMHEYSYFNKGITFIVTNAETKEVHKFLSKNGLKDFAEAKVKDPLLKKPIYIYKEENGITCELILQWTTHEERFYLFSNGGENPDGGSPITGIRTGLTNFFKKEIKEGSNVARRGLTYICSVTLNDPIYDGQTKTKITNPELRGLCQRATKEALELFKVKRADEYHKVIEFLTKELKAERAAERARQQVMTATRDIEKNQKKKVFASDKLKDANTLGQDSILLIVEGNSAGASMAVARDTEHYGILPIRGKLINALSNSEEKIFKNEEIKLLLSAMNIVPGKYDPSKLRYGKIAITTDADSDGYHIGLLITAALRYLAPQFIEEDRLCWLRTPLYVAKKKNKPTRYFFSDEEYAQATGLKGYEISREKGLGALSAEQARESMFDPSVQRLDVIQSSPRATVLLEELMGDDVQPRRDYIKTIDFSVVRE